MGFKAGFLSWGPIPSVRSRSLTERRAVMLPERPLPVVRQCCQLNLPRSSCSYRQAPESGNDLELMRRIDAIHFGYPEVSSGWEARFVDDQARAVLLLIESVDGEEPDREDSE